MLVLMLAEAMLVVMVVAVLVLVLVLVVAVMVVGSSSSKPGHTSRASINFTKASSCREVWRLHGDHRTPPSRLSPSMGRYTQKSRQRSAVEGKVTTKQIIATLRCFVKKDEKGA